MAHRTILIVACVIVAVTANSPADTVRVAICQMRVDDGQIAGNLAGAKECVERARGEGAEICVFPELMDVGFGDIVKSPVASRLAFAIPGPTSDQLGAIARTYGVWIVAALLEAVPGGAYDTSVVIDQYGTVVHKQRKTFCYPSFAGTPSFQGNHLDFGTVRSPWGPLAVLNCVEIRQESKRKLLAAERPSLVLVNFANPQANLVANCNALASECRCPVVGANMIFPPGSKHKGGRSRFVAADGQTLWEAGPTEAMQTYDLTVRVPRNAPPRVAAGDPLTIQFPTREVALKGAVLDDGFPDGITSTRWSKLSGPRAVTFADPLSSATSATLSAPGAYVLQLTANDGELSRSDSVSITVLAEDGSDPHLAGYWTFDQTAEDQSGHGNHAELRGGGSYAPEAAPTGFANTHALSLADGAFALVPHSRSLDAQDAATVALWVRVRSAPAMWPNRPTGWVGLLAKGKWWEENYALGFGDYFYVFGRGFGGMVCPALDNTVRTSRDWHHVAAVLDANKREAKLYLDGVLNHRVRNAPSMRANSEPLYMGCFSHESNRLDGLLDDVRVYTRALSDEEVAALVPGARLNRPPVVDAGANVRLDAAGTVTIRGSCEDDDAFATSRTAAWVRWDQVAGPADVRFENRFVPVTSAVFPASGSYLLELRASDGAHVVSDTVSVTVR